VRLTETCTPAGRPASRAKRAPYHVPLAARELLLPSFQVLHSSGAET
jgi:hypothetical protein